MEGYLLNPAGKKFQVEIDAISEKVQICVVNLLGPKALAGSAQMENIFILLSRLAWFPKTPKAGSRSLIPQQITGAADCLHS